jgi:hypothetical protein
MASARCRRYALYVLALTGSLLLAGCAGAPNRAARAAAEPIPVVEPPAAVEPTRPIESPVAADAPPPNEAAPPLKDIAADEESADSPIVDEACGQFHAARNGTSGRDPEVIIDLLADCVRDLSTSPASDSAEDAEELELLRELESLLPWLIQRTPATLATDAQRRRFEAEVVRPFQEFLAARDEEAEAPPPPNPDTNPSTKQIFEGWCGGYPDVGASDQIVDLLKFEVEILAEDLRQAGLYRESRQLLQLEQINQLIERKFDELENSVSQARSQLAPQEKARLDEGVATALRRLTDLYWRDHPVGTKRVAGLVRRLADFRRIVEWERALRAAPARAGEGADLTRKLLGIAERDTDEQAREFAEVIEQTRRAIADPQLAGRFEALVAEPFRELVAGITRERRAHEPKRGSGR